MFVDLENIGGSCKPSPIAPQDSFLPHPFWYGTGLSLGPVFSPLFLLFLVYSSWVSIYHWQLDCREKFLSWLPPPTQGTTIFLSRETLVLFDPGRAPTLPWAQPLVALGTAAWPQEQGYYMTSAGAVLSPPPDCTS